MSDVLALLEAAPVTGTPAAGGTAGRQTKQQRRAGSWEQGKFNILS
jgi:hypothetical protein